MDVRRALAWSFAAVIVAAGGPLVALEAATGANSIGSAGDWLLFGAVIASAVVGLLLALRRPANPIGWLLLTNALVVAVGGLAKAYPGYALSNDESLPGIRLAAAWYTWGWPTLFAPIVAIALIFPDGRLPSARWRKVVIGGAISFAVVVVTGMLWDGERLDAPFESIPPYAVIPDEIAAPLHNLGLLGMIATIVLAAVALVSRFRGADGVLRLQLKWIAYAGTLVPIAIIAGTVDGVVLGNDPGLLTELPFALAMAAIPTAIGIAVLRYRLYEIDRLINATLVYGALTALLAIAFAGVSLGLGVALGGGSTVPTAVATLAVVLAFRPLRDRIQLLVDRRFNRARYEGLRLVGEFLEDLRLGRAEPEAVGAVLARATGDPSLELFFWLPRDSVHADAGGHVVSELPSAPAGRTPVRRGELELATIVHDPGLLQRPSVLDAIILRAGLAIEIARLRVEVRRRLAEVERSRARIVAATYEERRRLERDLHDGAQQRLVSIGLDLRRLQRTLDPDAHDIKVALDSTVTGLAEAISELRELARGVRPAALDGGLAPALRELAARTPIRTALDVTRERFDEEIEAAAYFVASEGLTNAVKHADPSQVVIRAERIDGSLVMSVVDDGRGAPRRRPEQGSAVSPTASRRSAGTWT